MAQCLRACAALAEKPGLVSCTHKFTPNHPHLQGMHPVFPFHSCFEYLWCKKLLMTFNIVLSLYFFSNLFSPYTPLTLTHQVIIKLWGRNVTIYILVPSIISQSLEKVVLFGTCLFMLWGISWLFPGTVSLTVFKGELVL